MDVAVFEALAACTAACVCLPCYGCILGFYKCYRSAQIARVRGACCREFGETSYVLPKYLTLKNELMGIVQVDQCSKMVIVEDANILPTLYGKMWLPGITLVAFVLPTHEDVVWFRDLPIAKFTSEALQKHRGIPNALIVFGRGHDDALVNRIGNQMVLTYNREYRLLAHGTPIVFIDSSRWQA